MGDDLDVEWRLVVREVLFWSEVLAVVIVVVVVEDEASRATGKVKRTFCGGLCCEMRGGCRCCFCTRLSMEEEEEEWLTLDVSRNLLACCDLHPIKRERDEEEEGDGLAEAEAAADAAAAAETVATCLSEDRLRARRGPRTQLGLERWRLVF